MASLALASFDVILVGIVWGCLHDGAHTLQRELYVWLARLVKADLLLPELQSLRGIGHEAAAVRQSRLKLFDSPKKVRSAGFPFLTVPAWMHLPPSLNPLLAPGCLRSR